MIAIEKIGVVGAGQMGNGIAHVCALSGHQVVLNDISAGQLEDGLKLIEKTSQDNHAKAKLKKLRSRQAWPASAPARM